MGVETNFLHERERDLRQALSNRKFELWYEPQRARPVRRGSLARLTRPSLVRRRVAACPLRDLRPVRAGD